MIETKKQKQYFILGYLIVAGIYFGRYFEYYMTGYNTTLFAMSYKYGFISRGLLGSFWLALDGITPFSLMNYQAVYVFTLIMTIFYLWLQLYFCLRCLDKVANDHRRTMVQCVLFLLAVVLPMYIGSQMLGRLDLYLYILTLLALLLLLEEKWEWLIIPIGIVAMLIHQGFVFTNANLILVPMFFVILTTKSAKKRKKYLWIGILFFVSISVLFLYFEFFSHSAGMENYEEILMNAKALSYDGESYNVSLIHHEILGEDVYEAEAVYRAYNRIEFPAAVALFSPYIFICIHYFSLLLKGKKKWELLAYGAIPLGMITILPEMILKVDYGRYAFGTIFYIFTMLIFFLAKKDKDIEETMEAEKRFIKKWNPIPYSLLVYVLFLIPFWDNLISIEVHKLATWIF